ncbi:hypothetical protein [Lactobacillus xylocopicola]|nr:hypothetical protein [Lactobacillus xylocopicola]
MKKIKVFSVILEVLGFLLGLLLFLNEVGIPLNTDFYGKTFSIIYTTGGILTMTSCLVHAIDTFSKSRIRMVMTASFSCTILSWLYDLILFQFDLGFSDVTGILAILAALIMLTYLKDKRQSMA